MAFTLCSALSLLASEALADGVAIDQASPAQLDEAQRTFVAADALYDNKQYEAARTAFRTSFDIVASPNSLLMIARCSVALGRFADAHTQLEDALRAAEAAAVKDAKYAPTLQAVKDERVAVRSRVGLVHLRAAGLPPGATVTVGGQTVEGPALEKPVVLAPGSTVVVARAEGYAELRQTVEVAAGGEAEVTLQLERLGPSQPSAQSPTAATVPPPETSGRSPLRTAALVTGAFGVANLAGFVVLGLIHNAKYSRLEDECPNKECPADLRDTVDSGKTFQTLANTSLVIGAVGVSAGAILFAVSTRASARPLASATIAAGPGTVRLMGTF
ncbi:MAG: PEGA domain-containing protein [Polyangiaceae bacterium]